MWIGSKRTLMIIAGASAGIYAIYRLSRRYFSSTTTNDWQAIGTVTELYIHPLKSGKPIQVDRFECSKFGAIAGELRDRSLLIIDIDTKLYVTIRQISRIVLIAVDICANRLSLSVADNSIEPIDIDLATVIDVDRIFDFNIKDMPTNGYDCGDAVANWLRQFLDTDRPLRLLYFVAENNIGRQFATKGEFQTNPIPYRIDDVAYQDKTPYMAFSQASLDNLNEKFDDDDHKYTARHFRPNIVVGDGCPAFDEDRWSRLRIGTVTFVAVKPCTRCLLTTVDPETGIKDVDQQPLKTLREYRLAPPGQLRELYKQSPIFGVHMGVDTTIGQIATIHVGDRVYAQYKSTPF